MLVAFHGYKQNADDALARALAVPGVPARWRVVAPQGLHRFYASGNRIVASWMTRQDRDDAIADNVAYVDAVLDRVGDASPPVFVGFSQGASMAYRAAVLGKRGAAGVIALAGDIPPELKSAADLPQQWPPVLIGVGDGETFYTPERVASDAEFLRSRGVSCEVCRFKGGHEWTDEFRGVAAAWLGTLA